MTQHVDDVRDMFLEELDQMQFQISDEERDLTEARLKNLKRKEAAAKRKPKTKKAAAEKVKKTKTAPTKSTKGSTGPKVASLRNAVSGRNVAPLRNVAPHRKDASRGEQKTDSILPPSAATKAVTKSSTKAAKKVVSKATKTKNTPATKASSVDKKVTRKRASLTQDNNTAIEQKPEPILKKIKAVEPKLAPRKRRRKISAPKVSARTLDS